MIPPWLRMLQAFIPQEIEDCALDVMMHNSSNVARRDMSFFVFIRGHSRPRWIVRCHDNPDIVTRQFLVLQELTRLGFSAQPKALGKAVFDDIHALLLRFSEGTRLTRTMLLTNPHILASVISTLTRVQTSLNIHNPVPAAPPLQTLIPCPKEDLDLLDPNFDLILKAAASSIKDPHQPSNFVLPQHGDFTWNNLLLHHNQVIILDWEHFGFVPTHFFDLWTLILSLLEDFSVESFGALFRPTSFSDLVLNIIRSYSLPLHLTPQLARQSFSPSLINLILINTRQKRLGLAHKLQLLLTHYLANSEAFLPNLQISH